MDELCVRLHQLSLLLSCDLGKGIVRLHDVMRSYLIQRAGSGLSALHTRFLDVSKLMLGLSRWADLPSEEHYLWQHLVLHLCSSSQVEELQATLTDPLYLARKALSVGISGLEADLLRACTFESVGVTGSVRSLFESLHRTIVRISHLLRHVSTLAEVGGVLLSYLGWQPPFATQNSVFWYEFPRPFLTAWHPLPSGSSSVLLRTLRGHTSWVNSCAVSPDNRFIVSASWDHTLKVWDAATGAERLTLMGHTSEVRACAVSPDSHFIVSASHDKTLKVWDAATGAERLTLTGLTSEVRGCAVSPDGGLSSPPQMITRSRCGMLSREPSVLPSRVIPTRSEPVQSVLIGAISSPAQMITHSKSGMLLRESSVFPSRVIPVRSEIVR